MSSPKSTQNFSQFDATADKQSLLQYEDDDQVGLDAIGATEDGWRLSRGQNQAEMLHNELIREDFFYEQAPSLTLALALIELHSDSRDCGVALLATCEHLMSFITSTTDGRPNPEIDYPLLIKQVFLCLI